MALGIDNEAKLCLCTEGIADRDTALYRNPAESVLNQEDRTSTSSRIITIDGVIDRAESRAGPEPYEFQSNPDEKHRKGWGAPKSELDALDPNNISDTDTMFEFE